MNYNVANQVDRERSTTITISSQRSSNSEGGRAGVSSHGTHVFGTVRTHTAPALEGGNARVFMLDCHEELLLYSYTP